MPDPAQLAALAAVHRRGAFDLAAADLSVTPSAISQRIKALEERAGTLLIRRGQPCTATPAGLRLIRHHDELALLARQLAADLPHLSAGPATLRIAVNADSLATWVIPALAATQGFLFDLVIDDQAVSQDWLRRGDVVAAVTAHAGPLQGCQTLPLGALRYRATASPAYMAQWFPDGITAPAIARAPALVYSEKDRLQHEWLTRYLTGDQSGQQSGLQTGPQTGRQSGPLGRVPAFPSHRLASSTGFVDAALAGLGWGLNPEPLVADHLASGALVELAPHTPLDVPLHWQFTRLAAPAIRPLTDAIRQMAARVLVAPPKS